MKIVHLVSFVTKVPVVKVAEQMTIAHQTKLVSILNVEIHVN